MWITSLRRREPWCDFFSSRQPEQVAFVEACVLCALATHGVYFCILYIVTHALRSSANLPQHTLFSNNKTIKSGMLRFWFALCGAHNSAFAATASTCYTSLRVSELSEHWMSRACDHLLRVTDNEIMNRSVSAFSFSKSYTFLSGWCHNRFSDKTQ